MYSILYGVLIGFIVILCFLVYGLYEQLSKVRISIYQQNLDFETMQKFVNKVSGEVGAMNSTVSQIEKQVSGLGKAKHNKAPSVDRKRKKEVNGGI